MNDLELSVAYLQRRAEHCRQFARRAHSGGIADELERLAAEYDKDAADLEALSKSN